jgi:TRAP-type mannitol/chloroaromatic compound transport system permease large subunit
MRIRRAVIISVILALSVAGSILAGLAMPAAAAQMSGAHPARVAALFYYYG